MLTFTKNITMTKYMVVEEICEYAERSDSPDEYVLPCLQEALKGSSWTGGLGFFQLTFASRKQNTVPYPIKNYLQLCLCGRAGRTVWGRPLQEKCLAGNSPVLSSVVL